ncbi:potassium transporter [Lindgomyces ingoldianus]|uniref:Potassium transporter n=1 Tax=Lindgomyces ingoldianus TaxID=673940 RepID=A0ACB6R5A5_9PLEO|nr:potassium transporter [Lindgomyces ingoldianus]KAF2473712.1 potassium transporter [Lindgomyces ingoldianus]
MQFITPKDGPRRGSVAGGHKARSTKILSDTVESFHEDLDIKDGDLKRKQIFKGWVLLWLAYQSTGVIYGDIGTSPLYVYSSTFSSEPSYTDLLDALSLIIWPITLIITVKYVCIVLCAGGEDEGRTFAMYSLLARYCNISVHDPKTRSTIKSERYDSNSLRSSNKNVRSFMEQSSLSRGTLKALAVFGVSLILADGILTPAQSVLGAIQASGYSKIGNAFAPAVLIWLLSNICFGIYNLVKHDYTVLKAFSPYFARDFLARVEALFANLGAFSKRAIQLSCLCFAYPSLLLAYIGQAAFISHDPSAFSNPFFNCVPPGMFYLSLAMIASLSQLLSQVMNMSYFPQIKLVYTSKRSYGQSHIPVANLLLMIGTVIVTAVYNNTTSLGQAYGVCVILVTFITINIIALLLLITIWLPFVALDGIFLSSAITKVSDGAWFTLLLAFPLASICILWRYGKRSSTLGIFDKVDDLVPTVYLEFLRKFEAQQEVHVFLHLRALSKPYVSAQDKYTIQQTSLPNCYLMTIKHGYNDRAINADLGRIIYEELREGIVQSIDIPDYYSSSITSEPSSRSQISDSAVTPARRAPSSPHPGSPSTSAVEGTMLVNESWIERRLTALYAAYKHQVVYIVGKEQIRLLVDKNNLFKRAVLGSFIWSRENTRTNPAQWRLPVEKLVEVGFVKEV